MEKIELIEEIKKALLEKQKALRDIEYTENALRRKDLFYYDRMDYEKDIREDYDIIRNADALINVLKSQALEMGIDLSDVLSTEETMKGLK